jgi:glycosyltransferase involved in cell wall biosynthesis
MPEILSEFSPDLITTSTEASAIAEKLEQVLLGNIPTPSREACREYATTHYDWNQIAQQVRNVLLN